MDVHKNHVADTTVPHRESSDLVRQETTNLQKNEDFWLKSGLGTKEWHNAPTNW